MDLFKTASVITAALLLNACASNSAKYEIPEQGKSSIALQVTHSAGSGTIIEDQTLPKGAISNVGIGGYVGSTAIGLALGSMTTGFGLAILADQKYGWDRRNLIMYLDADTYGNLDKYEICKVVLEKMKTTMPTNIGTLQSFTDIQLMPESKVYKERYNGGEKLCAEGYELSSTEDSNGEIYFRPDEMVVGSMVGVWTVSEPVNTSKFYGEIQQQIPESNVVAVRFRYQNSLIMNKLNSHYESTGHIDAEGFSTSPYIKLPTATFMSLPKGEYITPSKYIPYINAVRDNDTVYYFIKPIDGKQFTLPLNEYHSTVKDALKRTQEQNEFSKASTQ